jgi:hypothetical protein
MFFDLKSLKDSSNTTRPIDFYIKNGEKTLNLKYPMVIYCDSSTCAFIKEIRDRCVGDTVPTEYIIKNLTEYDLYKLHWDIITKNRKDSAGYGENAVNKDARNTVSYFLMGMFKPYCLWMSKQYNFFNTTHYAWIDLGCNHIVRDFDIYAPQMLDNPNPKVSMCYIHYRSKDEIYPYDRFIKYGGPCGIATTAYTVESDYIEKFYLLNMNIFYDMLYNGYGHTDETVATYAYDKDPSIFSIYNGDYYSIFSNYHIPRQDHYIIYECFIKSALNKGKKDLAKESAKRLYNYSLTGEVDYYILQNLVNIIES